MIPTGCPKSPMSTSTWSGSSAGRSTPTPSAGWTRGLPETYPWWWNCTGSPHCVVGAPTVTVAVYPIISPQKCPGCEPFPHIGAERAGLRSRILRRVRTGFRRHPFMATGWRLFLPASDPPDRGPGGRRTGPGWRPGNRLAQGRHGVGTGEFGVGAGVDRGGVRGGRGCGHSRDGRADTGPADRSGPGAPAPRHPRRAGRARLPSQPQRTGARAAPVGRPGHAEPRGSVPLRQVTGSSTWRQPLRVRRRPGPGRRADRARSPTRPDRPCATTEPPSHHDRTVGAPRPAIGGGRGTRTPAPGRPCGAGGAGVPMASGALRSAASPAPSPARSALPRAPHHVVRAHPGRGRTRR